MTPDRLGTGWLADAVRAAAERPFVLWEGQVHTFGEIAAQVARVQAGLLQRGVSRSRPVAVAADNEVATVVGLLALMELGVPFVPLHPRLTATEQGVLLADCQPSHVLTQQVLAGLLDTPSGEAGAGASPPQEAPRLDETLAILYTSGTSGQPKGAVLSRGAFAHSAWASATPLAWEARDRWLLTLPLCHIGGLSIVTRCLLAHKPLILHRRFDPEAILRDVVEQQATLLSVVPTMLHRLLDADGKRVLAALRIILCGGAATPPALHARAAQHGCRVLTTYGLTEACSQVTVQPHQESRGAVPGSGLPLPGTALAILDDADEALPPGQVGRICVAGPTLFAGYLHQPARGEGWFDTGDLGYVDPTGALHVQARRTDLIVTGGENVYPVEIEHVLLACTGVVRALVFGVPDARWGALVAAALVVDDRLFDQQTLAQHVARHLAPFKHPRRLCLCAALPELPSGKPDRRRAARDLLRTLVPFVPGGAAK